MTAIKEYKWDYIAPGATVGVYIHGYLDNEAVAYSAVVYGLRGEDYFLRFGSINLTQERVDRHIDGTIARTVWVQNLQNFNPCSVDLLSIVETI